MDGPTNVRAPSRLELLAILGSATPPGRLHRAVADALARVEADGSVSPRLIDLAKAAIAPADGRPPDQLADDTEWIVDAIAAAPVVLLATPVYRGSLTGTLKNLLDHVPVDALRDTVVPIVSMGASNHHLLGAERHLRDLLAFFGAIVAPTASYLTPASFADGVPTSAAAAELDELIAAAVELTQRVHDVRLGPAPLASRTASGAQAG
jgi:FMN reductase